MPALDTHDPDILTRARRAGVTREIVSPTALSAAAGVSVQTVYRALRGEDGPGVRRVLAILGLAPSP